jgi:hypothetical protein
LALSRWSIEVANFKMMGMVKTVITEVNAVRVTQSGTSALASQLNMFADGPPGQLAIIISPNWISGDRGTRYTITRLSRG